MTEKKIVIIINSSPFNSLNNYEALRSCMSFFDHETTIILRKNGVYCSLNSVDNSATKPFIRNFDAMDINLYVDGQDIEERELQSEDLIPEVEKLQRSDVLKIIKNADVVLSF